MAQPNIDPHHELPRSLNHRQILQETLDRFARAVVAGDGRLAASMWSIPALVVGDEGVRAIASASELVEFFGSAREQYNKRGIVQTHPEIMQEEWVTPRIAIVDVRWPWVDTQGLEVTSESSTYTLRKDDAGVLKLVVAVTHGTEVPT